MATTTPNFGWPVPTSSDLVKNGATAIEGLGDAIDASLLDLKGGTTGQVLSKASNTDMDFTWVTDAAGDITGVTAGTGISGGGTSGTVTVTNSMATAIDAKGDLIGGTGADTFARLAVGANGTVLTADSAEATGMKWASAGGGGGAVVQIADTTLGSAAADITFSSIPSTYNHLMVIISGACSSVSINGTDLNVQLNSDTTSNYRNARNTKYAGAGGTVTIEGANGTNMNLGNLWVGTASSNSFANVQMTFPNYKLTTMNKTMMFMGGGISDAPGAGSGACSWSNTAAITTIKIFSSAGGNFATGTRATLYGWT